MSRDKHRAARCFVLIGVLSAHCCVQIGAAGRRHVSGRLGGKPRTRTRPHACLVLPMHAWYSPIYAWYSSYMLGTRTLMLHHSRFAVPLPVWGLCQFPEVGVARNRRQRGRGSMFVCFLGGFFGGFFDEIVPRVGAAGVRSLPRYSKVTFLVSPLTHSPLPHFALCPTLSLQNKSMPFRATSFRPTPGASLSL